jgi:serine-type D-Ala-D-Ala carboxypeptidase (penicillin-binding protein 5/6)
MMGSSPRLSLPARGAGYFAHLAVLAAVACLAALGAPPRALAWRHRRATHARAANPTATPEPYAEACVMEPATGTVIFEKNDHQPWPTASLAKMMLMYIVADKLHDGSLKLTDQITTSRNAARMGGSQVYLREGEKFSLDDMMKAVVVHSANDASVAVAEYIAGSTDAFVQLMNQTAAKLGMKDTRYYSVHGLPPARGEKADVSSAYDEALLARALVQFPRVLRWSSIDTAPFRGGTFTLRNTNHLVRTYRGCDGLKTGYYEKAGFNVAATARRGNLRLIAVVLGTPHKLTNFKEAAEMLSQGFLDYEMRTVAAKGATTKRTVPVTGGTAGQLTPVFGADASVFARRSDGAGTIKVKYDLPASVAAPIDAGQRIGTAQVIQNGKPVESIALLAPAAVAKRGSMLRRIFGRM